MKNIIRLYSETGDVNVILQNFKELVNAMPGIQFKFAEIRQKLPNIPNDRKSDEFYPLKLQACNGLQVYISEVRTGYHGASSDAMIEILKLAGFKVSQKVRDEIYNSLTIKMTLWNEDIVNQY